MSDAYILYVKDRDNPILHREGLPGLTPCGLAFTDLFGAVMVGTHKPGSPVCKECFPDE